MILIGQQEKVVIVGPTEAHHCLHCRTETGFAPPLMLVGVAGLAMAGWTWRHGFIG